VVWELDGEMDVRAVAAGIVEETLARDPVVDEEGDGAVGGLEGERAFFVGRRDTGWSRRIEIERDAPAAEDVAVAREGRRVVLDPVAGPRDQRRLYRGFGPVDARSLPAEPEDFDREPVAIVEVAGHRPASTDRRADLDDLAGGDEQVERSEDRLAIRAHRRHCGGLGGAPASAAGVWPTHVSHRPQ